MYINKKTLRIKQVLEKGAWRQQPSPLLPSIPPNIFGINEINGKGEASSTTLLSYIDIPSARRYIDEFSQETFPVFRFVILVFFCQRTRRSCRIPRELARRLFAWQRGISRSRKWGVPQGGSSSPSKWLHVKWNESEKFRRKRMNYCVIVSIMQLSIFHDIAMFLLSLSVYLVTWVQMKIFNWVPVTASVVIYELIILQCFLKGVQLKWRWIFFQCFI